MRVRSDFLSLISIVDGDPLPLQIGNPLFLQSAFTQRDQSPAVAKEESKETAPSMSASLSLFQISGFSAQPRALPPTLNSGLRGMLVRRRR